MTRQRTRTPAKAPSPLVARLRARGILAPRTVISEAERAGLPLALACALLEKESDGGHNVYGHDPSIFRGRGKVTRANYAEYRRLRVASRNRSMQGVGPCQLTWWELQDAADAQGGCWRPEINMRVGFGHLAALVERHGTLDGARRYNGSGAAAEAYARDLVAKARGWQAIVRGARAESGPANPAAPAPRGRDARLPGPGRSRRRGPSGDPGGPASRLDELVLELQRRDAEAEQAWRRLVAHAHRRSRLLSDGGVPGGPDAGRRELLAALARIEGRLQTLVEVTEHGAAGAGPRDRGAAGASAREAGSPVGAVAASAAPGARGGGRPRAVPDLLRELELAERRRRRLRAELLARYARADRQVARRIGEAPSRPGPPEPPVPHGRRRRPPEPPAPPGRRPSPPRRHRPPTGRPRPVASGGRSATTRPGDRGRFVRRSKVALARFLADRDGAAHRSLRRRLRREAATPGDGDVASPAWARAVEAAQRAAGRPVTRELDGELTRLLLPYWPRDHLGKRVLRSTPAWRAIPGQLTPNFNLAELACKDAARTPYVAGLAREQGLGPTQARGRAKELATRLERLRRLGGDRPLVVSSAYRTRAYNAALDGAATNSSHTRGYAADTPPPPGVSLEQHRQHALRAFECGVGFYPLGRGSFVHGDFDRTLGGRRVW